MSPTRRTFIQTTALAGGALSLGMLGCSSRESGEVRPATNPLRILILGGTGFIGPHQVRYALQRGHTITLFNRGRTNPHLFPEVEKLIGDRAGDLTALEGREWDAVIDNPTMLPQWVRDSAGLLKDAVQQYLFISTLSVFANDGIIDQDEMGELCVYDEEADEPVTGTAYGGRKVICEREAEKALPGRTTVVRPGLISGPGDPTLRFPYWPIRVDRGGEVLVQGQPGDPVQFIDARDLAEFVIGLVENSVYGIYNATGPRTPIPMGEMLEQIRDGLGATATFTWADEEFLDEQGVLRYLNGMGSTAIRVPGMEGYNQYNIDRALAQGLTFRSMGVIARDTVDWWKSLPEEERSRRRTLSPEREVEVLAAWRARATKR
ncbi:NAD-dependent epimerase/dehydratase family protein [Gemmatimonadota bacterium]